MARGEAVGLIGLGNMGRGIAANVVGAGFDLAVWDADDAARRQLGAGMRWAAPEAMTACRVVLFTVPSSVEVAACLERFAEDMTGNVVCDLTTSDPAHSGGVGRMVADRGGAYLDIGMSGGAAGARDGTVTLMAGGDDAAIARARPVLESFAGQIHVMGGPGNGHTAKLIHNQICHAVFLATCEGCLAAEQAGIGLAAMLDVINDGNGRSYASEVRLPRHVVSARFDGGSYVATLHKDLTMAVAQAGRLGAAAPYARLTQGLLARAMERDLGGADFTTLYRHFAALAETGDPAAD